MIGCLWTCVHKQPIIALYFESENELKFYNLEARFPSQIDFNKCHEEIAGFYKNLVIDGASESKLNLML